MSGARLPASPQIDSAEPEQPESHDGETGGFGDLSRGIVLRCARGRMNNGRDQGHGVQAGQDCLTAGTQIENSRGRGSGADRGRLHKLDVAGIHVCVVGNRTLRTGAVDIGAEYGEPGANEGGVSQLNR